MSETLNAWQRVHAIMQDIAGVPKTRTNSHGGYKFAGHDDITSAIRHLYVKHRLVRSYQITRVERLANEGTLQIWIDVIWTNIDDPNDRIVEPSFGEAPAQTKTRAATAQQMGVAVSYAVKVAELKLFSLKGDDTPDPEDIKPLDDEVLEDFIAAFEACTSREQVLAVKDRVTRHRGRLGSKADDIRKALAEAQKRFPAEGKS